MPKSGDRYLGDNDQYAVLHTPLAGPGIDVGDGRYYQDECDQNAIAIMTWSATLYEGGDQVACLHPLRCWHKFDDIPPDYDAEQFWNPHDYFDNVEAAAERGDMVLRRLGFVPESN